MRMTIEMMSQTTIAFIRKQGPYGAEVKRTMEDLKVWASEHGLLNEASIIFGIAHDNPTVTKAEDCRYDACLVIQVDYPIDGSRVQRGEIGGGKYAVFEINHTAEAVQKAWSDIFKALSDKSHEMDHSRPILERYVAWMVDNHRCEICVPIL